MTKDEALKLALEALKEVDNCTYINDYGDIRYLVCVERIK